VRCLPHAGDHGELHQVDRAGDEPRGSRGHPLRQLP
jgi:hypothetical protein